ncbi:sugar phosphate isomerase/epimerase family protein [Microbacterium suaedae]|uniref:sugar phosphate isomerase/epimerase family protein n=1 Tax=Microbacterium suaedae TaxID=2067813 RepID=UPI000DA17B06|nr:TIM barrel protein [Microbacterium suaedae]
MIGLGTYAYFWQHAEGLSLAGAFEDTRAQGVELFQICDYAPLEEMTAPQLRDAARAARDNGLSIELGTKGIAPDRLARFLDLAEIFDARLVRSMLYTPGSRPTLEEATALLRAAIRSYESAGVELALETYEQVPTRDLLGVIDAVGSDALGICLDPANVVAQLESPRECVEQTAHAVKNVHVKDFAFARQDGWVGFTYSGARMGEGLHDYDHLLRVVDPRARGINEVVEHWLPWQTDAVTTIRNERDWTRATLEHLRSTP